MHAWHGSAVRHLSQPVPQPGPQGTTGFTKRRPYTVTFAEPARVIAAPCASPPATGLPAAQAPATGPAPPRTGGPSASADTPATGPAALPGWTGHIALVRKRGSPVCEERAPSADAAVAREASCIPAASLRGGLFFDHPRGCVEWHARTEPRLPQGPRGAAAGLSRRSAFGH